MRSRVPPPRPLTRSSESSSGRRCLPTGFTAALISTTGRRHIAADGSGDLYLGSGSCTSVIESHSSDRSAAGSPADCSSGRRLCGPRRTRGGRSTRSRLRRRSRNSPTARRRDTPGCSDPGGCRFALGLIRAKVSCWHRAEPKPGMRCRSRSSGCASRARIRNRDTASCADARTRHRQELEWSLLSGLNR
jgi:hypothetical protein